MSNILKTLAAGSASEPTDEYFNQTTLLLHGDGTNGAQNNTFLDSSTPPFTITRNGNTTQGPFSPFSVAEGEFSNFFNTSAYLSHSAELIGSTTSTFTAEGWVYLTATPTSSFEISAFCGLDGQGNGANNYMSFGPTSDSKITLRWFDGATKSAKSTNTLALNTWYYIACVVNSNSISLYINGVSEVVTGTPTLTNRAASASESYVGGKAHTYATLAGYVSNVRVSSVARTITAQTAPLSSDANTILLTCQSNRFVDNSASPKTLTIGGSPPVQPFSPYAPSAAYSPSVNGGSASTDGAGDYLTVPNGSAFTFTGNFTVEVWVYSSFSAVTGNAGVGFIDTRTVYDAVNWSFGVFTYGGFVDNPQVTLTGGVLASSINCVKNAWNHVALCRSGSTLRIFVNGAQGYSGTVSGTISTGAATNATILSGFDGTNYLSPSSVSGLRVVNGTALYTSAFTPPTAPPTAITNTVLLTNFTNAGIFDNTGKHNLETVGNAQIDTATKKYGTGSMEFDGTGDYLVTPSSPNIALGTGDFTIECWTYFTSLANKGVFQISTTAGGLQASQTNTLAVNYDSGGSGWGFYAKNSSITGAGTKP